MLETWDSHHPVWWYTGLVDFQQSEVKDVTLAQSKVSLDYSISDNKLINKTFEENSDVCL